VRIVPNADTSTVTIGKDQDIGQAFCIPITDWKNSPIAKPTISTEVHIGRS
jgi:hypothetical protein